MTPIGDKRSNAIKIMQHCGWSWERKNHLHYFKRPDTGGLYDVKRVSHKSLSPVWAARNCDDEELTLKVLDVYKSFINSVVGESND